MGTLDTSRLLAVNALPDTCDVLGQTNTADGLGGQTRTWETIATGLRCRVADTASRYSDTPDRIAQTMPVVVYLPWGTEVIVGDRLETTRGTFTIRETHENSSALYVKALCGGAE